jgi:DNA invertase Pin-like site-specific DNA recombinase
LIASGAGCKHLIDVVEVLAEREVGFRSLTEAIDTKTPARRLQLHLFGALAEFARELIRERTRAGWQRPAAAAVSAGVGLS